MTREELNRILENHQHWLNEDCYRWQNMRANLNRANLRGADLYDANLSGVNLNRADLSGANLSGADLSGADLSGADLYDANLSGADLYDANLSGANLRGADFSGANLNRADLSGANLNRADLSGANLNRADLSGAKGSLIKYRKGKILTEDIIGYKKCRGDVIVKLLIPRGAIVFSINGNKCRTNKAKVLEIEGRDRAVSKHKYMSYYVGDEFTIYNFNCMYNNECAPGIHFFMTREEAVNY